MGGQGDGDVTLGVQDTRLGSQGMEAVSALGEADRSWPGGLCGGNAGATSGGHLECDRVASDKRTGLWVSEPRTLPPSDPLSPGWSGSLSDIGETIMNVSYPHETRKSRHCLLNFRLDLLALGSDLISIGG